MFALKSSALHLARSRLLHFVVLGLVVWKLAPVRAREREVVVDAPAVADAIRAEQARLSRALTAEEKQRVMAVLVADEVLYREGARLGIGGDDAIVRARVADRMRSHLLGSAPPAALTSDEVRGEASRTAARMPMRVHLRLAFVSKDRADAAAASDALARSLFASPEVTAPYGGDRAPTEPEGWWLEEDLARIAGASVARAAMETAVGTWSSPAASTWGFYIVRPLERRPPTADELMDVATANVRRRRQADAVDRAVSRVAADYAIRVQVPAGEPAFDPSVARAAIGSAARNDGVD